MYPVNKKVGLTINIIPEKHAINANISFYPNGSFHSIYAKNATITHDIYLKTNTSPIGYA